MFSTGHRSPPVEAVGFRVSPRGDRRAAWSALPPASAPVPPASGTDSVRPSRRGRVPSPPHVHIAREHAAATVARTPVLVEPFVEVPRFTGGVYRSSGSIRVGTTTGRGRHDTAKQLREAHHGCLAQARSPSTGGEPSTDEPHLAHPARRRDHHGLTEQLPPKTFANVDLHPGQQT